MSVDLKRRLTKNVSVQLVTLVAHLINPSPFSGLLFAALDHVSFSRQQGWKSQAMRAAYITVPIQSMFVSYVALRELSANVMQSYGKNRNSNWTYVAAGMGPGTILMYWHSKLSSLRSHLFTCSACSEVKSSPNS